MRHVFISYKRVEYDSTFAEVMIHHVEKANFDTWIDGQLIVGEEWRLGIDDAIKNAFALIVIMTPEAKASEYVTYEWAFALGIGIKVIPVLLRHTPLHPRLEALQYIDFTDHNNRPWDKLISALKNIPPEHDAYKIHIPQNAPDNIKAAITALDSDDPSEQKSAIERLVQANHPLALEVLTATLYHPKQDIRTEAALTLIEFNDFRAVPGFTDALKDENEEVYGRAAKALKKLIDANNTGLLSAGRVGLLEALKAKDSKVRETVVKALGIIGDTASVPALLVALHDEDPTVRELAAEALGTIGDTAAVPGLLEALHDEFKGIRENAVRALSQIGDVVAIPGLTKSLHDEDPTVRELAAEALGTIGDTAAVPGLLEALHDEKNGSVRRAAVIALDDIGDISAVPELLSILANETDGTVSFYANGVLNRMIGNAAVIPALVEALHDKDSGVRKVSVKKLGNIGDASAVPALVEALHDKDNGVRRGATEALGNIGDASAVPALVEALHDKDNGVRRGATEALGNIGDASAVPKLIEAFQDSDTGVQQDAVNALGQIGIAAITELLIALYKQEFDVHYYALQALSKIGVAAIPGLLIALNDPKVRSRNLIARLLGKLGNTMATDELLVALLDNNIDNASLRIETIEALGLIGDPKAVPDLISALLDKDEKVCIEASKALRRIGTPEALNALQQRG